MHHRKRGDGRYTPIPRPGKRSDSFIKTRIGYDLKEYLCVLCLFSEFYRNKTVFIYTSVTLQRLYISFYRYYSSCHFDCCSEDLMLRL